MRTKKAMKKTGLRYFSSLSPKQKDLALDALKALYEEKHDCLGKQIKFEQNIHEHVKGQKMFKEEGTYYPLKLTDILKK